MPMRRARRPLPPGLSDLYPPTAALPSNVAAARVAPGEATTRGSERQRELDRECAEVNAAVLLASGGRVTYVVVCNLRHGRVVAQALRGVAGELGVGLELRAHSNGIGTDIAVHGR
jgi:hypothetical protein